MSAPLPKRPDIKAIEEKWQDFWEKGEFFKFDPDPSSESEIFSIDVPPRYVSGPLHVGHAISYTHIDFTARYMRLRNKNVFNPLCFDVNGLPIEVNVEKKGISPAKVGRAKFVEECAKFGEANIDKMIGQFKRLGHSFDPSIYYQTNADYYRKITQLSFLEMFEKGHVYRDEHPVNWCTRCRTAISDAEVEYKEGSTSLNFLKFFFENDNNGEFTEIATTRPELLPACVLLAVHPDDERFKSLHGRKVRVPIFNRKVEIIADENVDPAFGTGVVMICTFGDKEDIEWAYKYGAEFVKAIDEDGLMTDAAGEFSGLTTVEARKQILNRLKENEHLLNDVSHDHRFTSCWRCSTPIEYIITRQWFMKIMPFKEQVKASADRIKWYPSYMKNRLENWVDSLRWDWPISRQRYFATPIPAWLCGECETVVPAESAQCYIEPLESDPPMESCPDCGGELKPSEEVFDTWFDSSVTAIYNAFWRRDDELFSRMHPMSLRPQSHDIIRTWAYFSILRSALLTGREPFSDIAVSGFILGPDGRPMHTSDGNVVDPLEVIDQHGCEAMRFFAAHCGLGVDTSFNWETTKHGTSFNIKLWNIARFIGMQMEGFDPAKSMEPEYTVMDRWMLSSLTTLIARIEKAYESYDFHAVILALEDFIWHILADNYLEVVKHRLFNKEMENAKSREAARSVLDRTLYSVLKGLAPVLPHITEEIFQNLFAYRGEKTIHLGGWPEETFNDEDAVVTGNNAIEVISAMRKWKQENQLGLGTVLTSLVVEVPDPDSLSSAIDEIKGTSRTGELKLIQGEKARIVSGAVAPKS